jgi:plasmid stability protein
MWITCFYRLRVPKMIQIRHVPDDVHRRLKARAALAGMSLSEYLLAEARRSLERPTRAEILDRIARRRPVNPRVPAAAILRAERDRG